MCWQRSTLYGKQILEVCGSYKVIKGKNTKDRGAGLESGRKQFWRVMGRPLLREDIQNKDCHVYSYVYIKKQCTSFLSRENKVVPREE